ncbi:MAG: DUF3021 domain-containing protein [Lachnospiraceae bacterium]|nr:DUF3021 domain-containing protein [Lachnospiraceae bacterium]
MKRYVNSFIFRALIGALMGIAICLILYGFGLYDEIIIDDKAFVIMQFVGSALNGIICMGSTIVYAIDNLGLSKVTLLHYVITLVSFLCFNFLLGWFSEFNIILILAVFTVAYFIIWLVNYLIYKREIRRMNIELEDIKQKAGGSDE